MTTAIVVIYILLITAFLIVSAFIFRHTLKFSYLSPRFRKVIMVFGIMALAVIIYSIYLITRLDHGSVPSISAPSNSSSSDINF